MLTGFALLATTGVLEALFAAGPTPHRVRAALPSLIVVAAAAFYDAMQRARERGTVAASQLVTNVLDCVTGAVGIAAAASVVAVLQPILLVLLLIAELPGGWAAVRAARIGYITDFALTDSRRRKWMLADLMAERRTAAEMRSFTLRHFMLARVARLAAYARDAELVAAGRQARTRVVGAAAGGVATAGVYTALGILLAAGAMPLAFAGTAVLAIRSAQASLAVSTPSFSPSRPRSTNRDIRTCPQPDYRGGVREAARTCLLSSPRSSSLSPGSSTPRVPPPTRGSASPICC